MTSFINKLHLLTWKCFILRKRNVITTILELAIPILLFYLLSKIFQSMFLGKSEKKAQDDFIIYYIDLFSYVSGVNLAYTPNTNFSNNIMQYLHRDLNNRGEIKTIEPKETEGDLVEWLRNKTYNHSSNSSNEGIEYPLNPMVADLGILFSKIDSKNNLFKYDIRTTDPLMVTNVLDDEMGPYVYLKSGFLGTQEVISKALLRNAGVSDDSSWMFGHLPSFQQNGLSTESLFYFMSIFIYLFFVISVIKDVMSEKECGIKELMKIMGVDSWMIWVHWFIYAMMAQLPVIIAATIFLTVLKPVAITAGVVIVFLLLLLFIINLTVLLFTLTCLFYKSKWAITICVAGWFFFNQIFLNHVIMSPKSGRIGLIIDVLSCLFPVANLSYALASLLSFQAEGQQWMWSLLFTRGFTKFRLSVGLSIIFFILSTTIHICILIYLDNIFPGPYGVPKPVTFICHWLCNSFKSRKSEVETEIYLESAENFEPASKNAKIGIMLRGLRKTYGVFKKVVAVEKVDLDIYQGEIMALLGHNGAGKTTTMSIITGMTDPTGGVIMYEGQNITVNKKIFREDLGFCPQHNLYFSKLTVIEHLMFFGMLKGMTHSESKRNGNNLLDSLSMLDKRNTRGAKLSGGMKRRLCLAVSLIGNPKVLIMDEPTSGLDPQTRRVLWDIILRMRGERTVLITTHFMEEADVLGDRIAIMDHGRVVCCGTTMFLKRLFGAGYHIHVLKNQKASVAEISSVVQQNIPQFQTNVISDFQVDFVVKEEFVDRFPDFLSALERQKSSLGITGITVTCSSMEDVFIKVATIAIENGSKPEEEGKSLLTVMDESEKLEGTKLFFQRVKALFSRRIIHRRRKFLSLAISFLFILITVLYLTLSSPIERTKLEEQKGILLNFKLYPTATVLIGITNTTTNIVNVCKEVAQSMFGNIRILSNISDFKQFISQKSSEDKHNYTHGILFTLMFDSRNNPTVLYHAATNVHAPAIAINFLTNILLKKSTNGTGLIEVINHPFVNTKISHCDKKLTKPLLLEIFYVYPYAILLMFDFIILLGDFIEFVTLERTTGFKHQQYLAGASSTMYWVVNFAFDFFVYFVVTIICLVFYYILGPNTDFKWFGLLFVVLSLQGWSTIALIYVYTFVFDSPDTSNMIYQVFMNCLGLFPAILLSTGIIPALLLGNMPGWFIVMVSFLSLNPIFAAAMCLRYIFQAIIFEESCRVCQNESCPMDLSNVLKMPTKENMFSGILLYFIFLVCTSLLYPLGPMIIDCGIVRKLLLLVKNTEPHFFTPPDTDVDVRVETLRVEEFKYAENETPLRVESLEKKYFRGPKAVDGVSFLVEEGDCFGLLGVNGAGKSTTFKMLTAEILPDKGDAYINEYSVKTDRSHYIPSVGYCPQFAAILPPLTGKEILSIFAKIRGIPSREVKNVVEAWLDVMGIREHGDKNCDSYSGGTKRKLSTAMALIGLPEVVMMDEPTTGVDPASRRKLWTVIKEMQKQGQAVVLTSHSMEECEALCNRLTIMVAGRMKCIGSVEYLKTKYGQGYTVQIKLKEHTDEELQILKDDFTRAFPKNSIKDEHEILIHYTVLDPKLSLSKLFGDLLRFKSEHPIVVDFTAANTTLEELFLSFASEQHR